MTDKASDQNQIEKIKDKIFFLLSTHKDKVSKEKIIFNSGDYLIRQGELASKVLLINSGVLAVEVFDSNQKPQVVANATQGELIGEMGLFGESIHTASVRVVEGPAEIEIIDNNDLLGALIFDSELVLEILQLSTERCKRSNSMLSNLFSAIKAVNLKDADQLEESIANMDQNFIGFNEISNILRQILTATSGDNINHK